MLARAVLARLERWGLAQSQPTFQIRTITVFGAQVGSTESDCALRVGRAKSPQRQCTVSHFQISVCVAGLVRLLSVSKLSLCQSASSVTEAGERCVSLAVQVE